MILGTSDDVGEIVAESAGNSLFLLFTEIRTQLEAVGAALFET